MEMHEHEHEHDHDGHDHDEHEHGRCEHGHDEHEHDCCGHGHDGNDHDSHAHDCCEHDHDDHDHDGHAHDCCGHDHDGHAHEHHAHHHESRSDGRYVYLLENLDCANCAAKMEEKVGKIQGVEDAVITFATKELRVWGADIPAILPQITAACTSIEPDVRLIEKESVPRAAHTQGGKRQLSEEHMRDLRIIIAGAVLFVIAEIVGHAVPNLTIVSTLIFIAAYIILGAEVIVTAVKNIGHGQIFDENFLMVIATLGAFAIQFIFRENYSAEAVGVMLFYRVGEFFEHVAVERSRSQIMDAVDMRPETVNLISGGDIQVIPAKEASIGDLLLIRPGDRIPLDGVVTEGTSRIDTSPVTGEPVPVKAEAGSELISGCVNTSGQLKMRVEKPLGESMVTKILDSVENAAASKPKIDRFITKFSRIYTPVVVFLALAVAVVPSLITGNWHYWVYTALTFLVMSCPCALVLSVPLAFFSGIGAGSKLGILFKGGLSLEALAKVRAVVMDKTGTVTEGNFKVQKILSSGAMSEDDLLAVGAGCEYASTHPIGISIVTAAEEKNLTPVHTENIEEIAGQGIRAQSGAQTILCGSRKLLEQSGVDLSGYENDHYGTEVLIAIDGRYAGCIVISDTLKADARDAVRALREHHIAAAMLTGDSEDSAMSVAREAGIEDVRAHLMPEDKLRELRALRDKYGSVMFVGDGINDAPVLAGADVGAAMGSGADAAIEAADVVFMTSKMQAIPQSLAIARTTSRISWQNVIFALTVKIIVMILGLCGLSSMWMAVFADTGVAMICIANSIRILYHRDFTAKRPDSGHANRAPASEAA